MFYNQSPFHPAGAYPIDTSGEVFNHYQKTQTMYNFISNHATDPNDFSELRFFVREGYAGLGEPEWMAIRAFTQYPNSPAYRTLYGGASKQDAEETVKHFAEAALEEGWLEN